MQRDEGEGDAKQREPSVSELCGGAGQLWGGARALLQLGWHHRVGDRLTGRQGWTTWWGDWNAVLGALAKTLEPRVFSRFAVGFSSDDGDYRLPLV